MRLESIVEQRGLAADIRQRNDNADRKLLSQDERQFLNEIIHEPSLAYQPQFDTQLLHLAARVGSRLSRKKRGFSVFYDVVALSAVVAFAMAMYSLGAGACYASIERERQRERQRLEAQAQQQFTVVTMALAVGSLGLFALWYREWLYVNTSRL